MISSDSSSDEEDVDRSEPSSKNLTGSQPSLCVNAPSPVAPAEKKISLPSVNLDHKRNSSLDTVSIGSQGSPKLLPRLSIGGRFSKGNKSSTGFSTQPNESSSQNGEYPEDSEHKRRLQLYVFVCRCIAYPFNAKQSTDIPRRQSKVTKQNLTAIKDRFLSFLEGKTIIVADEAFKNAVQSYYDTILCCDRVHKMVNSGGFSSKDFREIFKANIEKRVRSLPNIEGLSKETVLSSWMAKFDAIYRGDEDQKRTHGGRLALTAASELILSKEQLYEMFQTILGVKHYEHQILFNACQLDNPDEQSRFIRRELQSRQKQLRSLSKENMPKFIHKNMEEIYVEEMKNIINNLQSIHLEAFPVTKSGSDSRSALYKMKRVQQNSQISTMDVNGDNDAILTKALSGLTYELKVTVVEASGLKELPHNRIVFVVMELDGSSEKLSTDQAEAGRPLWDTQADWTTNQPFCLLKLRLMAEHSGMLHLTDDKELAQVTITPYCGMSENKWYTMQTHKGWNGGEIKIKLSISMDKPSNVKKSGFLYAKGLTLWKTWKRRFFMLIQVSQYKFVLCSYRLKKQTPKEVMVVEGYTADFADKMEDLEGGRFFFNMVKAGDEVTFAAEEDHDQMNWIYKLYTATGQSYRPALPSKMGGSSGIVGTDPSIQKVKGDMDRALKHGLGGIVEADPFESNQASEMFPTLQRLTLLHRLNDSYTCLGWLSPGQLFVLEEYRIRYAVRACDHHLCFLNDLLERAENGIMIDPTLLHYSYAFCSSHVVGNRPDGVNTVTVDEKERFEEIRERLRKFLANQITHFRYCFPFGRPEGALKSTLNLFERVLSKDTTIPKGLPDDMDDVNKAIRKCLMKAALVNYQRISSYVKVPDKFQETAPKEKLQIVLQLADLCIELIQQNEEHHADALAWYNELMMEHTEMFWSLFAVDMDDALKEQPRENWDSFALFRTLNNYLRMESPLRGGRFHQDLMKKFAPYVIHYIDMMESAIEREVYKGFLRETYQPMGHGCALSEDIFWKLRSIQAFIQDLHWPDDVFNEHMMSRLKLMAADVTAVCVNRVLLDMERTLAGGVDLHYVIPPKVCVMINFINEADEQSQVLCTSEQSELEEYTYHGNINETIQGAKMKSIEMIVNKLSVCIYDLLKRLSRFDQGTISSKFFSLLGQREEAADDFVLFICNNIDQMHQEPAGINDMVFINSLEKALWESMCEPLCQWLVERPELAVYQYTVLSTIIERVRSELEKEGLTKEDLENSNYKAAYSKLQVEEAMLHIESSSSILTPRDNMEVAGYESRIQRRDSDEYEYD